MEDDLRKSKNKRQEAIKKLLKEILYNSLSQAIIKIIFTRHAILRIFLFFCVLLSTCLTSFLIIKSMMTYLKYGVTSNSRTIYETPTLFPKVTFCNLNQYATEYAWNLDKSIETLSIEEKKKLGHDLKDILLECFFNNKECNEKDFVWSYDVVYGNCFTFNSGVDSNGTKINLKESSSTGLASGLKLTLYVNVYEKFNWYRGLGAVIRIGNSSYSTYFSDSGMFLPPGFTTYISVEREFKSMLPKPFSNCEIDSNFKAIKEGMDLYNLMSQSEYEYTQKLCFVQCYQKYIISENNCSYPRLLSIFKLVKECPDDVLFSILSEDKHFDRDFINKNCLNLCPLECEQNLYKTSISLTHLNGNSFISRIGKSSKLKKDFINRTLDSTTVEKSIASVYVFYDSLSYNLIIESPQMDGVTLLGSIGGNLGLFLGVSVFSLCEVIEAVVEIFFVLKQRKN